MDFAGFIDLSDGEAEAVLDCVVVALDDDRMDAAGPCYSIVIRNRVRRATPNRIVFSWDISPQWRIETDHNKTSEVEVRFVAETPERTRAELEHRNLDRRGPGWESERDGVGPDQGWPLYMRRFADVVAADT